MPAREYEILIRADGSVELKVHGHPGKSCENVAKIFAEIIGVQTSQEHTHEFYEPDGDVHTHLGQSNI